MTPFEAALLMVEITFFNAVELSSLFFDSKTVPRCLMPVFTDDFIDRLC